MNMELKYDTKIKMKYYMIIIIIISATNLLRWFYFYWHIVAQQVQYQLSTTDYSCN